MVKKILKHNQGYRHYRTIYLLMSCQIILRNKMFYLYTPLINNIILRNLLYQLATAA